MQIDGCRRALVCLCSTFLLGAAAALAAKPVELVTPADIEEVLGRATEPDLLDGGETVAYVVFDPATGSATTVQVYTETPEDWKQLAALRDAAEMGAETFEELSGVGDAAVYRFRDDDCTLTVEKTAEGGARTWLTIGILDAGDAAAARRFATELGKRAAKRL